MESKKTLEELEATLEAAKAAYHACTGAIDPWAYTASDDPPDAVYDAAIKAAASAAWAAYCHVVAAYRKAQENSDA